MNVSTDCGDAQPGNVHTTADTKRTFHDDTEKKHF